MGQFNALFSMRDHPIPPVTEPFQFRAIGLVRGIYRPSNSEQFTRGCLVDPDGLELEAVVLGRVMTLMRRHLEIDKPHLWVVYPRCRELGHLHLQVSGIWEPSTLERSLQENAPTEKILNDSLPEGDDYFSIRGELIFTKPAHAELVIKVRQQNKFDGSRRLPFKLQLRGEIPLKLLRQFVSLEVRRKGQDLFLESYELIGSMPMRGGSSKR